MEKRELWGVFDRDGQQLLTWEGTAKEANRWVSNSQTLRRIYLVDADEHDRDRLDHDKLIRELQWTAKRYHEACAERNEAVDTLCSCDRRIAELEAELDKLKKQRCEDCAHWPDGKYENCLVIKGCYGLAHYGDGSKWGCHRWEPKK